jgi:DNA helicase-2/ATP-dependent DNA helicase PcrA
MYWNDRLKQKDNAYIDFILNKIEQIIYFYDNNRYSDFFKLFWREDFKINTLEDRKKLKDLILELKSIRNEKTIWEVLNYIFENKILIKTEKINLFEEYLNENFEENIEKKDKQEKNKNLREELMKLNYKEIISYNKYIEKKTPYSTQHWTKWAEYNNVLLVIDDNHRWYLYRWFDKLIAWKILNKDEEKALKAEERLLNLLYVSVSRAKNKLAILYLSDLDLDSLNWWGNIFWKENIIKF